MYFKKRNEKWEIEFERENEEGVRIIYNKISNNLEVQFHNFDFVQRMD